MGDPVAFSARLKQNVASLDVGNQIKFQADLNVQNGYLNASGTFTAPLDGYYYLAYTVAHKNQGAALTVCLQVNGVTISSAFAEKANVGSMSQCGNGTVVKMNASDTAQVIIGDAPAAKLVGNTDGFTSFSGYKIN